jgi:hypothetical protein
MFCISMMKSEKEENNITAWLQECKTWITPPPLGMNSLA